MKTTFAVLTDISHRRSYSVEASNSLTSFVNFCFKDRFLRKIELAQFTFYGFTKLISHSLVYLFSCELRFF